MTNIAKYQKEALNFFKEPTNYYQTYAVFDNNFNLLFRQWNEGSFIYHEYNRDNELELICHPSYLISISPVKRKSRYELINLIK